MELLRLDKSINRHSADLSHKSRTAFAELCFEKDFAKGSLLTKPHQYDRSEYILLKGIIRTFLLNTEGG